MMNYYIIHIEGKVALYAQSPLDRYESLMKIASTMSSKACVKRVNKLEVNYLTRIS
ncbi:hypothetical protein [Priestia aryabhattai]